MAARHLSQWRRDSSQIDSSPWRSETGSSYGRTVTTAGAASASGRVHYDSSGVFFETTACARNRRFDDAGSASAAMCTMSPNSSHYRASQILFEQSERGSDLAAKRRATLRSATERAHRSASPRAAARSARSLRTAMTSFSDYDARTNTLSQRTPTTPQPRTQQPLTRQVSSPLSLSTPSRGARDGRKGGGTGDGGMTGELCVTVGAPRWLPADASSCYVTATCLETGEVETSAVPIKESGNMPATGYPPPKQTLHLQCAATNTVTLHVIAVRRGKTTSAGGTTLSLPHLAALLGSGHGRGGGEPSAKLQLVAPLGIPVDLKWFSDDDITA